MPNCRSLSLLISEHWNTGTLYTYYMYICISRVKSCTIVLYDIIYLILWPMLLSRCEFFSTNDTAGKRLSISRISRWPENPELVFHICHVRSPSWIKRIIWKSVRLRLTLYKAFARSTRIRWFWGGNQYWSDYRPTVVYTFVSMKSKMPRTLSLYISKMHSKCTACVCVRVSCVAQWCTENSIMQKKDFVQQSETTMALVACHSWFDAIVWCWIIFHFLNRSKNIFCTI